MYPRSANIIKYHKNHRSTKSVYNLLQLKEKNPEVNLENVRVLYTTEGEEEKENLAWIILHNIIILIIILIIL